jgi:hypothetical protein
MRLPHPININGVDYTHLNVQLAITYTSTSLDDGDATAAMRIVPSRIEDGKMVAHEPAALNKVMGSLGEVSDDPAGNTCATKIYAAVVEYLYSGAI